MSRNSPLPPQNYHQMQPQQQQSCPQGYENGWRGPPQLQIQPPLTVSSSSPSPSPQFYSPSQPSPYQQQQIYRPILQQQQQQQQSQQQQPMYSPMYSQPRPQQQAQPQRPSLNKFAPATAPQKISSNNFPSPSPNPSPMNVQLQQQPQMYNPINRRPDNQSMLFGKPRSGKIQPEAAIAPMPIIPSIEELTIYEMPGCQQLPPPKQQQFSRPQSQQSNPIQLAPPKQQPQITNRISPLPMLLSIQQPQQQQQQHHYQFQYNKNASPTPSITPQPKPMYSGANGGIQAPLYGHRQGVSSPPPLLAPPQPPAMMLSTSSTTSLSSSSSLQQLLHPSQFEFHPPAANSTPLTTTTNPPAAFNNNRSPNNMENMSGKNYNNEAPDYHNYGSNNTAANTTNKSALDKFMEQNEFSVYSAEMAKKYLSDNLNSITLLKADFDETSSIEPSYLREDSSYGDKTLMPTTFDKKLFRKFEESSMYFGNSNNVPENDSISDIKFTPALPPPPLHNNKPFNPHFYTDNCMNKYNDSVPVSIEDMQLDNTTRLDFYAGGGMSSLNISTSTAKNSNFGAEHDHKYEEYRHRYMKDADDGSDDEKWPFPNKETETDFNNRFNNNNNNGRRFSPRVDSNDSRGVSPPSDSECNAVSSRNIPNQIIDIDAVMNLPKLL